MNRFSRAKRAEIKSTFGALLFGIVPMLAIFGFGAYLYHSLPNNYAPSTDSILASAEIAIEDIQSSGKDKREIESECERMRAAISDFKDFVESAEREEMSLHNLSRQEDTGIPIELVMNQKRGFYCTRYAVARGLPVSKWDWFKSKLRNSDDFTACLIIVLSAGFAILSIIGLVYGFIVHPYCEVCNTRHWFAECPHSGDSISRRFVFVLTITMLGIGLYLFWKALNVDGDVELYRTGRVLVSSENAEEIEKVFQDREKAFQESRDRFSREDKVGPFVDFRAAFDEYFRRQMEQLIQGQ